MCKFLTRSEEWSLVTAQHDFSSHRLVILGGGPGGYEAAIVGAHLGAQVTIVERDGLGGAAVLTDVVPSKTLIATADAMRRVTNARDFGVRTGDGLDASADLVVNARLLLLARDQSTDIHTGLERAGVRVVIGQDGSWTTTRCTWTVRTARRRRWTPTRC